VWPRSVAVNLLAYHYDPSTRSFAMVAVSGPVPVGHSHDTVVYVPSVVRGAVSVSGDGKIDAVVTIPDGSSRSPDGPSTVPRAL